jgi:enoyl-CoA hydratase/carnithine racemase
MTDVVLREIDDGVALLTLNRPDRLNAWTGEMQVQYNDLLDDCAVRDDVRAIVVTGAGRGFCAGADMQNLQALSDGDVQGASSTARDPRPVSHALMIPKPVVAAINGPCAGLGLAHALMCDIRFAAAGAKFTTAFAHRGLIAEHGTSWMLPRLVGPARALDLLMSARVLLGAEAAEIGLVNRAVEGDGVLDVTLDYARELAHKSSPSSMARMKAQVYGSYERSLAESLEEANRLMLQSFTEPDFGEGVASFLERRPPNFQPLAGAPIPAGSAVPPTSLVS